jgi:integrase/recombinase XerD
MVLEDLFRRPAALIRHRMPPLGPEMDGFCDWLRHEGLSRQGVRRRVWQVSHFNQYLQRLGVRDCRHVERRLAQRFIDEHLPRCRCGGRRRRNHAGVPSSVRSFIDYLSERSLLPRSSTPSLPNPELLQEYLDYLKRERALADKTLQAHRQCLIPFLEDLGAPAEQRLTQLTPQKVLAFLVKDNPDRAPSQRRLLQGVLRSFFRFCFQRGYLERDLAEAIPPLRTHKLSGVPRALSQEEARKTLQCIDRTTPAGRRDFAILQLLYTYGVRGGQVRALRLQDIQWREDRIRFSAYKGGKEVVEPLFQEVGESLLDYLRHGRPQVPLPEVFLTLQRPFRPLTCPSTVSQMVAQRMRQAGIGSPRAGSHAFRHAFATRMLQHGQSLKTIADLLGHRNINTTFIYTKVDLQRLQQVPLDWPEGNHE